MRYVFSPAEAPEIAGQVVLYHLVVDLSDPVEFIQLLVQQANLILIRFTAESQHQRIREWPGLVPEIFNVLHFDTGFFLNLPLYAIGTLAKRLALIIT